MAVPIANAGSPFWRARWVATVAALIVGAALAGTAAWNIRRAPPVQPQQVVRLTIALNPDERLLILNTLNAPSAVVISPDGTRIAYVATRGGAAAQIYVRPIDGQEARPVPGTEGGLAPFFSPDGQWLGFSTAAGTFKVSLSGGAVQNLGAQTPFAMRLGSYWGADGMITFGSASGLQQVPDAGGTPRPLTNGNGDIHRLPDLLPGGRGVLFDASTVRGAQASRADALGWRAGSSRPLRGEKNFTSP